MGGTNIVWLFVPLVSFALLCAGLGCFVFRLRWSDGGGAENICVFLHILVETDPLLQGFLVLVNNGIIRQPIDRPCHTFAPTNDPHTLLPPHDDSTMDDSAVLWLPFLR